ncbi:MAG: GntR family transcriptional regulator [Clostridiales bacterium]|nr:GntR family transcriptional regulator [Clostridiales bacterium]
MPNNQPAYLQLADLIQEKIAANEYNLGSKIPSERELSETFGISRMTVRKAIEVLIDKGLLTRLQGKGTFVSRPKIDSPIDTIQSMGAFIQESGLIPSSKVLLTRKEKAGTKYGRIFHISPEADLFLLFRLRLGDGEPMALEYTYIPYDIIPDIESYNFEQCSLYDLYEQQGIMFSQDFQELEIVKVSNPQASLLKVAEDSAVFKLHNTVTDVSGRVIEYTRSYVGANTFTFSSVLT